MNNFIPADVEQLLNRKSKNKYFRDERFKIRKRNLQRGRYYGYAYYSKQVEPDAEKGIYEHAGKAVVAYEAPKHTYKLFTPARISWNRYSRLKKYWKRYAHHIVRHQKLVSYGSGKMNYKHEVGIYWLID